MRRVLLAVLLLSTLVMSACSNTGFVIDNLKGDNSDVCIPKYDVNGNDLNNCGVDENTDEQDDDLSDLDDLLKEIENDLGKDSENDSSENDGDKDSVTKEEPLVTQPNNNEDELSSDIGLVKRVIEGELVELKPRVNDPDGDNIQITFSEPLDENGQWYTQEGDAGEYVVTVTASDGKTVNEQKLKIIVEALNKAPVIEISSELRFEEGEAVVLSPNVVDPEGSDVTVTFSGWMNSDTQQTGYEDAGSYNVQITATDGEKTSTKTVNVIVEDVNRAPVIERVPKLSVDEGTEVVLNPVVSDPDGDDVTLSYEEPFDSNGRWNTQVGDAGEYETTVVASDGQLESSVVVSVVIESLNKAPVLQKINDINVEEGQVVEINPVAIDPEGEPLSFEYSGWMTSNTYQTGYDDQGEHVVTVTVSDGVYTDSQDVNVIVEDVNREPVFTCLVDCE